MSYDILVLGGGAIGLACAWRLVQSGARVALLERGDFGGEASHASAGMLAAQCEAAHHPPCALSTQNAAMYELCLQSRALYAAFAQELREHTAIDIELSLRGAPADWREPGILYVQSQPHDDGIAALQNLASPTSRVLSHQPLQGFPAAWLPDEGQVENRFLVEALGFACEKSGVELWPEREAQSIARDGNKFRVRTRDEEFRAQKILLCGGAWSAQFLPPKYSEAIFPLAGQVVSLRAGELLRHIVYASDVYLVPRRDGRLLVGATMERNGFRKQTTPQGARQLLQAASRLVPSLQQCTLENHWAGLRPASADGLPLLGEIEENFFIAAGHFRNGILLTPRTAELMAAQLLHGIAPPAAFAPQRFLRVTS